MIFEYETSLSPLYKKYWKEKNNMKSLFSVAAYIGDVMFSSLCSLVVSFILLVIGIVYSFI